METERSSTAQQAKETAGQYVGEARQKSEEVVQQAKDTARTAVDTQKGRAAESIGTVAHALRQTGQQLRDQDQQAFGNFADKAAERIEQFSTELSNKSVGEMLDGVQDFARRDPQMFLGGAFLLGLVASRFLKSSERRMQSQTGTEQWQQHRERGYYERGAAGYPTGEGFRQGFSRPVQGTGYERSTYTTRPGSTTDYPSEPQTGQRSEGSDVYDKPPRKDYE